MLPLPCRHLRILRRSNALMAGPKYLPAKCSTAVAAVPSSSSSSSSSSHRLLRLHSCIRLFPLKRPTSKSLVHSHTSARSYSRFPVVASKSVQVTQPQDAKALARRLAVLKAKLQQEGIPFVACKPGQYNMLCPKCQGGTSKEMSLSVFIREDGELAFWSCLRAKKCGWKGHINASCDVKTLDVIKTQAASPKDCRGIREKGLQLEPLCEELITYFSERMITRETVRRNGIMQRKYNNEIVIAFPYRRNGSLVSCKYRTVAKKFHQEPNCEQIFYGLDDVKDAKDIIIVEGEMDKLSMEEAGYHNCISVPDAAPERVSKALPDVETDTKFQFIWNCKEYLEKASRIILATDADTPGQALAEELARRFGKERCWRVKWPNKSDKEVFKDANEVLMFLGREALRQVIDDAEMYPIQGLFSFSDFFPEIDAYYYRSHGYELGVPTGWRDLNDLYNVVPGELTVVTGVPNSGKSEWIDALLCNINKSHAWKFVLCSMENKVREHARKLLEKHIKKPFFDVRYGETTEHMTAEELKEGKEWLNENFYLIRCEDDCLPSIKWILQLAKAAVLRYGVRGLVIDPYNELDHQRPQNETETEYVSQMLSKIKRFAQHHSCHVWFVAHPRQLQSWTGGPPNLYDISGSAHFINKCDNGIVIHRNRDEKAGPLDRVQICVRKVRNKVSGSIGEAFLSYNRVTGDFMDVDN